MAAYLRDAPNQLSFARPTAPTGLPDLLRDLAAVAGLSSVELNDPQHLTNANRSVAAVSPAVDEVVAFEADHVVICWRRTVSTIRCGRITPAAAAWQ